MKSTKLLFEEPKIEIVLLLESDVITTSPTVFDDELDQQQF